MRKNKKVIYRASDYEENNEPVFQSPLCKLKSTVYEMVETVVRFLITIIVSGAVAFGLSQFIFMNAYIPTSSMVPTMPVSSLVFCLRTDYWNKDPERGDIVIFFRDKKEKEDFNYYTKRVIGLPGDRIEIIAGQTYINGELLDEPYLNEPPEQIDFLPFNVPPDSYLLMGDNRNNSYDGRYWKEHFVKRHDIKAKARFILFPLEKFGKIK